MRKVLILGYGKLTVNLLIKSIAENNNYLIKVNSTKECSDVNKCISKKLTSI